MQRTAYQRIQRQATGEELNSFSLLYTCTQVCDYEVSLAGLGLLCLDLGLIRFGRVGGGREKFLVSVEFVKTETAR